MLEAPMTLLRWRTVTAAASLAVTLLVCRAGMADEPRRTNEPVVLNEPSEITQVVDAFDGSDPFDLHLSLGYQHSWKRAKIRRESSIVQPGLTTGGYVSDALNIAKYSEETSRLLARADIGVYQDVALVIRLPIILSNDRKLDGLDGSGVQQSTVLEGVPGEQLFRLPFKSPTRSGIEYLALGLDIGILNQYRDETKPTWILGAEGRFSVSEPLHACNANPENLNQSPQGGQVECAHPSDIDRNGSSGGFEDDGLPLEGGFSGPRKPGISRGVTGLEVHTYLSRRVKYVEPYGGFSALFEFPNDSSDYGLANLKGSLVNHPPLRGSMVMGLAVVPWEVRDRYQRIAFDFRLTGTYVSEGRDYSELFDALGSSDAPSLRMPNFASYRAGDDGTGSVVDTRSQMVYFTGLTDVQQHASGRFSAQFTWQSGEYVKFNLGGAVSADQSHVITFDQACNPDFKNDLAQSGPCTTGDGANRASTGIPNPNYRRVLNDPGRRFVVDATLMFDAWIHAVVMF